MTTGTLARPTFETRAAAPVDLQGINLRAAAASDSGAFEGYLCRFNVVDSYGTHFVRGCFGEGGLDERLYSLLWMHDPTMPGATFSAEERDDGLWISGEYDATQLGQDMRVRAKSGSAPELSVGFVWLGSDAEDENAITSARLVEGSQITARMASVPGSQIEAVRHALQPLANALAAPPVEAEPDDEARARSFARARAMLLSLRS
jgi:HK97 family phage prohead protease